MCKKTIMESLMPLNTTMRVDVDRPLYSPPSYVYTTIGAVMSVVFILALVENICVIVVYRNNKKLHTTTNFWIISVITCDLLIVIFAFPYIIISSFAEDYIFGDIGCNWDGFAVTVLGTSSIFLLTGLSIHRHQVICGNHTGGHNGKGTSQTTLGIIMCFVIGLIWGVLPLIGWGSFAREGMGLSCAPDWRSQAISDLSYTGSMYVVVLFVPLIVIGYCYINIVLKVVREKQRQSSWVKQRRVRHDIKLTMSVALTIVSFLVSWLPYAIVSLLEGFFNVDIYAISPFLVQMPCLMAKSACIWNPIVYVVHHGQFRRAFLAEFQILKKISAWRKDTKKDIVKVNDHAFNGSSSVCSYGGVKQIYSQQIESSAPSTPV